MASMHMHIQGSMGGLLWPRCICISSGAREAFYGLDAYAYPGEHGRPSVASMHMHIQGSMGGLHLLAWVLQKVANMIQILTAEMVTDCIIMSWGGDIMK